MDVVCVQGSDKTPRDSPIEDRNENLIGNRYARERVSTCGKNQIVQSAPPGYPLVDPRLTLGGVVARNAGVLRLALGAGTLARDPLIANVVKGAGTIGIQLDMSLTQIVGSAGTRGLVRVELAVPDRG